MNDNKEALTSRQNRSGNTHKLTEAVTAQGFRPDKPQQREREADTHSFPNQGALCNWYLLEKGESVFLPVLSLSRYGNHALGQGPRPRTAEQHKMHSMLLFCGMCVCVGGTFCFIMYCYVCLINIFCVLFVVCLFLIESEKNRKLGG